MSEFKVKIQNLRSIADEEASLQEQLQVIYAQVIQQKNNISFKTGAAAGIRRRLDGVSGQISEECQTLKRMRDRLSKAADRYEKAENTICGVVQDGKVTAWEELRTNRWTEGLGKTAAKTGLDILTSFGDALGSLSLLTSIAKIAIDGDGLSAKDIISIIKGGKTSAEKIKKVSEFLKTAKKTADDWKKLFGLNTYKNLVLDSGTRWGNASATFGKTFMDKLGVETTATGATKVAGTTIAGWGLSFISNAIGNYEEYNKGDITAGRAVAETFVETGVDIAKGAAIAAAVAAGAAALGIGAPAVVVAGAGVVISAGLDFICKKITKNVFGKEKGLTETISDAVIDGVSGAVNAAKEVGKAISGAWSSAKDAFCGWGKAFGFG